MLFLKKKTKERKQRYSVAQSKSQSHPRFKGEIASAHDNNNYNVTLHFKGCRNREVQTSETICVINIPTLSIWNYPTHISDISVNFSEFPFASWVTWPGIISAAKAPDTRVDESRAHDQNIFLFFFFRIKQNTGGNWQKETLEIKRDRALRHYFSP